MLSLFASCGPDFLLLRYLKREERGERSGIAERAEGRERVDLYANSDRELLWLRLLTPKVFASLQGATLMVFCQLGAYFAEL